MAAFDNSAKVSMKGAQITFHDVVAESQDDKVTFKSSHNKRVICRLVGPPANSKKPPSVGTEITVVGKVRGRGLLGNVTLDNCTIGSTADLQPSLAVQDDLPSATLDAVPEENTQTAESVAVTSRPEELTNDFAPLPSIGPSKRATQRRKEPVAPTSQVEQHEDHEQIIATLATSTHDVPYRFYILLLLGGAVGYSIFSKLLALTVRAMRSSRHPGGGNTEEVRKAALEALLLKSSKHKQR